MQPYSNGLKKSLKDGQQTDNERELFDIFTEMRNSPKLF